MCDKRSHRLLISCVSGIRGTVLYSERRADSSCPHARPRALVLPFETLCSTKDHKWYETMTSTFERCVSVLRLDEGPV